MNINIKYGRQGDMMRLELDNVGKISFANIELNGMTVIAGENNTGKSTIGKMLFCVFHAFYKIEEQIREECVKSVIRVLSSYYSETTNRLTRRFDIRSLAMHIVEHKEYFLADRRLIVKEIEEFFINQDHNFRRYIEQESIEKRKAGAATDERIRIKIWLQPESETIQDLYAGRKRPSH